MLSNLFDVCQNLSQDFNSIVTRVKFIILSDRNNSLYYQMRKKNSRMFDACQQLKESSSSLIIIKAVLDQYAYYSY